MKMKKYKPIDWKEVKKKHGETFWKNYNGLPELVELLENNGYEVDFTKVQFDHRDVKLRIARKKK